MSASASSLGISKEMLDSLVKEAMQKEISRRLSKAKWIAITSLMRRLCRYNAIIYGGAVRSYIQRTQAAQNYYAYCKQERLDAKEQYCNREVHPESFENRNLFPADIDVFITEPDLEQFMKHGGGDKDYHLIKKSPGAAKYFFESNSLFKKALTLEKYECNIIHFCNSVLGSIIFGKLKEGTSFDLYDYKIKIDFVVLKTDYLPKHRRCTPIEECILYPPFGNPDFDVNLLSIKADGEDGEGNFVIKPLPILKRLLATEVDTREYSFLSKFKPLDDYLLTQSILEDIITGIREKRARPVFPILDEYKAVFGSGKTIAIDGHRLVKMLSKGFIIDKFNLILAPGLRESTIWASTDYDYDAAETSDIDEKEKCIICYDTFSAENRWFKCCIQCNGKMHQTCLSKYLRSIRDSVEGVDCPHCRTRITQENCPCKFITFFNAIDYAIASIHDNPHVHRNCDDCQRIISVNTIRACNCHIIYCRCKGNIEPSVYEIDD